MVTSTISKTVRHTSATCCMSPALGHHQQIGAPSGSYHGILKVGHELPGGIHAARAGPRPPNEVSAEDIEQRILFVGFQTAIGRRIGIVGVQGPNQFRVFFDNDPQGEVERRRHMALFKFPPAARQRCW
jgi:hypothetical protein